MMMRQRRPIQYNMQADQIVEVEQISSLLYVKTWWKSTGTGEG